MGHVARGASGGGRSVSMMILITNPKMPPHENEIEIADRNSFWWFSGRERGEREGEKKREREREMER